MTEPRDPRLIVPGADSQCTLATTVSSPGQPGQPATVSPSVLIGYMDRTTLAKMTGALVHLAPYKAYEGWHDGRRFKVTLSEREDDLWDINITSEHDPLGDAYWHGDWVWHRTPDTTIIQRFLSSKGCMVALTMGPLVGRPAVTDPEFVMWVPHVVVNARNKRA